jgi:glutamate-1-semialdehyde 2,1-aminomutase
MAAGLVSMELYDQEAVDLINGLGNRMRNGFQEVMKKAGIKGQVMGFGSLIGVGWGEGKITKARETLEAFVSSGELPTLLHLEMLSRGIYYPRRGLFSLSTPMTEKEIDKILEAYKGAFDHACGVIRHSIFLSDEDLFGYGLSGLGFSKESSLI